MSIPILRCHFTSRAAEALGIGEAFLRGFFPESMQGPGTLFLGLEAWQWITLGLLLVLAVVLQFLVNLLVRQIWRRWLKRVPEELLKGIERPLGIVAGAAIFFVVIGGMGLPLGARRTLILATRVVISLGAVWILWRTIDITAA